MSKQTTDVTNDINSNYAGLANVNDKISTILVCKNVPGSKSAKYGRTNEKYLATNELHPELIKQLNNGAKYKVTGKVDGTCARVSNNTLQKRRDIKADREIPKDWEKTGTEGESSGHLIGFMPLDKNDKWHNDCYTKTLTGYDTSFLNVLDLDDSKTKLEYKSVHVSHLNGHSVEVAGPKFQGNPHHLKMHCVMRHGVIEINDFPDLYDYKSNTNILESIKNWFNTNKKALYFEGVVLHLDNGVMFKIHRNHLDLKWSSNIVPPLDQISL
jgi:hypothetical protein